MNSLVPKNGFDRVTADIVGDHLKWVKHAWVRAGSPADMAVSYVVLVRTMRMGEVLWEDSAVTELNADYVIDAGVPHGVQPGYNPYSSVMLLDETGILCTFTSSSWGGRNALTALIPQYRIHGQKEFPTVELSSKARNNQYGTIDPVFRIIGWESCSKFTAILGEEPPETLAIAAPAPTPTPEVTSNKKRKRPAAEIIDDSIPF